MDKKWLNFAGLLHTCIYNREHEECPYGQVRKMDQVEKLEKLLSIKNAEAKQMLAKCNCLRNQCQPKLAFSLENLAIINQKAGKATVSV